MVLCKLHLAEISTDFLSRMASWISSGLFVDLALGDVFMVPITAVDSVASLVRCPLWVLREFRIPLSDFPRNLAFLATGDRLAF